MWSLAEKHRITGSIRQRQSRSLFPVRINPNIPTTLQEVVKEGIIHVIPSEM